MIILTRLGNGMEIAVNPDLIERAEHTPDTVLTLVDGHKLVVQEPLDEVVRLIRAWRASVAAEAILMARLVAEADPHTSTLTEVRHDQPAASRMASDAEDATLSDKAAQSSPFGRVLHLPAREL